MLGLIGSLKKIADKGISITKLIFIILLNVTPPSIHKSILRSYGIEKIIVVIAIKSLILYFSVG